MDRLPDWTPCCAGGRGNCRGFGRPCPLVIAELLSGDITHRQREMIGELLQEFPLHETPLEHWMLIGELRRKLAARGINVTIPDAHVAQCALDRDATLLSRDHIFTRIAAHTSLRLAVLR